MIHDSLTERQVLQSDVSPVFVESLSVQVLALLVFVVIPIHPSVF